jgi:general secretion pathway protein N
MNERMRTSRWTLLRSFWPFSRRTQGSIIASTMWQDSRMVEPSTWRGKQNASRRWALAGLLLGGLLSLLLFAPASWMARGLSNATQGHLLLTDTRGSIWSGSGVLVLSGGTDSRDYSALPGRVDWSVGLQGMGLVLKAKQACCINGEMQVLIQPGWGRMRFSIHGNAGWLARWPAAWLGGLGTPWNTLQLGGSIRINSRDFRVELIEGRWIQAGQIDLDFINLSSRASTLAPLGSYRFSVMADISAQGVSKLQLSTLEGALLLSGEGSMGSGKLRFLGEAKAAPDREAALNNLLNIIGRRQGARSVISIG